MDWLGIVLGSTAALVVAVLYVMHRQDRAAYGRSVVDPNALARELGGRFARAGEKLSLFGKMQSRDCEVAVIGTEAAPEISVRVAASSPFNLSMFPSRLTREVAGRAVRSTSIRLNSNFKMYANDAKLAEMFLRDGDVVRVLEKLMTSANTELKISAGVVEFSEIMPMAPVANGHLLERAKLVATLASETSSLPGAKSSRSDAINPPPRFKYVGMWVAGILGILIVAALAYSDRQDQRELIAPQLVGLAAFPTLRNWEPVDPQKFDPAALAWIEHSGQAAANPVRFSCAGETNEGYLLGGVDQSRRFVILRHGTIVQDSQLSAAGIVKVPESGVRNATWSTPPSAEPQSEGVMLIKDASQADGAVLYACDQSNTVVIAVPQDYRSLSLR